MGCALQPRQPVCVWCVCSPNTNTFIFKSDPRPGMWWGEVARKLSADSDGGGFQPALVHSRVHLDEAHRLPHCGRAELCPAAVAQPALDHSRVHLNETHRLLHCGQAELCPAEVAH